MSWYTAGRFFVGGFLIGLTVSYYLFQEWRIKHEKEKEEEDSRIDR